MIREIGVQSQVESYQKHKRWYLMLPCLTFNIIWYETSVSGAIRGKEWCPAQELGVIAIEKVDFGSLSTTVSQLTYI